MKKTISPFNLAMNEQKYIKEALKRTKGNKSKAALLLRINVKTLREKIHYYDIET